MLCNGCRAANRPPKGTPVPWYCEACGWALRERDGRETPDLVTVAPGAALLVAQASVADDENKGRTRGLTEYGPTGGHGLTEEGRTEVLRRAVAPVLESRKPAGSAR